MKKVKEFIKDKKKIVIPCLVILILVLVAVIIGIVIAKATPKSNEKELNKTLEKIGRDFYENYWYDSLREEEKEVLERLSITGFHVNLDNLGRYNNKLNEETIKSFVNSETEEACNPEKTKIIIYPNAPYSKTDYTIETVLDCGFNEEEKDTK